MIDRCNIGTRQAGDDDNILSLFCLDGITQKEPLPRRLPCGYELCFSLSYRAPWSHRPRGGGGEVQKNLPLRNNVDVRPSDGGAEFNKAMGNSFSKEGSDVRRQDGSQRRGCRGGGDQETVQKPLVCS